MTPAELSMLLASNEDKSRQVEIRVTGCAYACCSRGWVRKDDHEQTYHGYIDNLTLPEGEKCGTFMLYSSGLGTISYVCAVRFPEVIEVTEVAAAA